MYLNEIGYVTIGSNQKKAKEKSEALIASGYTVFIELSTCGVYKVRYFIQNNNFVIN